MFIFQVYGNSPQGQTQMSTAQKQKIVNDLMALPQFKTLTDQKQLNNLRADLTYLVDKGIITNKETGVKYINDVMKNFGLDKNNIGSVLNRPGFFGLLVCHEETKQKIIAKAKEKESEFGLDEERKKKQEELTANVKLVLSMFDALYENVKKELWAALNSGKNPPGPISLDKVVGLYQELGDKYSRLIDVDSAIIQADFGLKTVKPKPKDEKKTPQPPVSARPQKGDTVMNQRFEPVSGRVTVVPGGTIYDDENPLKEGRTITYVPTSAGKFAQQVINGGPVQETRAAIERGGKGGGALTSEVYGSAVEHNGLIKEVGGICDRLVDCVATGTPFFFISTDKSHALTLEPKQFSLRDKPEKKG